MSLFNLRSRKKKEEYNEISSVKKVEDSKKHELSEIVDSYIDKKRKEKLE